MSTSTIQTNELNDIFLPDGKNISILRNDKALTQTIRHAGLMRKGEDIFDVDNGVDYFGTIFTPVVDYDAARQSIAAAILKKPDVINIESLDVTIDGDEFQYEAKVLTTYGVVKVSS